MTDAPGPDEQGRGGFERRRRPVKIGRAQGRTPEASPGRILMRQTTHAGTHNSAGPLADAGPYVYDLPVAQGGGQPLPATATAPAPRTAWESAGWSLAECLAIFFISLGASSLKEWSGWSYLQCYAVLYAAFTILTYWSRPRPRPKGSFPRWALKMVGIWLNCYVGLVTVPASLRGLIPEPLAFGLPAFVIVAILYCVAPVRQDTGTKWPFWQWLLVAGFAAVCWASLGPSLLL